MVSLWRYPVKSSMNTYYRLVLFFFVLSVPALAIGAESTSVLLDCAALKMSPAPNQRVQLGSPPFSVLPPQGENWCSSILPGGASFLKRRESWNSRQPVAPTRGAPGPAPTPRPESFSALVEALSFQRSLAESLACHHQTPAEHQTTRTYPNEMTTDQAYARTVAFQWPISRSANIDHFPTVV